MGVVEVVAGVSEVLLTGGEEVDKIQLPRRSTRQLGGMDEVGEGEELGGVVVGGVDVGVSVVGDEDGEELPGSVVEGVDVEVGVEVGVEEEGGSLVDGGDDDGGVEVLAGGLELDEHRPRAMPTGPQGSTGGVEVGVGEVVDGVSDDEGVVLVDGGSVLVGSVEGLVVGDVVPGGVEDEEVEPGVVVPLPKRTSGITIDGITLLRSNWRWDFFLKARDRRA